MACKASISGWGNDQNFKNTLAKRESYISFTSQVTKNALKTADRFPKLHGYLWSLADFQLPALQVNLSSIHEHSALQLKFTISSEQILLVQGACTATAQVSSLDPDYNSKMTECTVWLLWPWRDSFQNKRSFQTVEIWIVTRNCYMHGNWLKS